MIFLRVLTILIFRIDLTNLISIYSIDHFDDNHRKVLGLFKTLLRHPALFGVKRLVEIMAINMFEVSNLTSEGQSQWSFSFNVLRISKTIRILFFVDFEQFFEGTPLDLAVNFGCDMFQCLCEASLEILQQHSTTNNDKGNFHIL